MKSMKTAKIPTEDQEWERLAHWLRVRRYKFTHIANEIGIRWHVGMLINKRKVKQWLNKGFPDYCIIVWWHLVFIELKRQKKILKNGKEWASLSIISEEQKDWIKALMEIDNVHAEIAYWADHAINIIKQFHEKH